MSLLSSFKAMFAGKSQVQASDECCDHGQNEAVKNADCCEQGTTCSASGCECEHAEKE